MRRCIHTDGKKASKDCNSGQNVGGGQQEVEGGEGQASRMRHNLPQEVINLHTYYADSLYTGENAPDSRWCRRCLTRPSHLLYSALEIRNQSNGIDL